MEPGNVFQCEDNNNATDGGPEKLAVVGVLAGDERHKGLVARSSGGGVWGMGASVEAEEEDSEAEEFASSVDILGEFEIF